MDEVSPKKRDEVFAKLRKSLRDLEVASMDFQDFHVEPKHRPMSLSYHGEDSYKKKSIIEKYLHESHKYK